MAVPFLTKKKHASFFISMPVYGTHPISAATADGGASSFKRKPSLPSLLLKAVFMALITSVFFVFLGIAAIILLHLCLAGGLLHRRRSSSSSSNRSPGSSFHEPRHGPRQPPRPGLSPSQLRRLPKFRFWDYGEMREECPVDCAICLDEVRVGEWCRRLIECGHVFHQECVDTWLVKVGACPVCRRAVRGLSLREGGGRGGGGRGRDWKLDGFQGFVRLR